MKKTTERIAYIPLGEATKPPERSGVYEVIVGNWWAHAPGKGLLMYRGRAPQCNANQDLARRVHEKLHPEAETIFVAIVFLRHDCGDYA